MLQLHACMHASITAAAFSRNKLRYQRVQLCCWGRANSTVAAAAADADYQPLHLIGQLATRVPLQHSESNYKPGGA